MKRNILLFIFVIFIFACTEQEPECGDPKSYECQISLIDSNDIVLIGTEQLYKPDSIYMTINNQKFTTHVMMGIIVWNLLPESYNNFDFLLHLSSTDTDTIRMIIVRTPGKCFDELSIEHFLYNGDTILPIVNEYSPTPLFKVIK